MAQEGATVFAHRSLSASIAWPPRKRLQHVGGGSWREGLTQKNQPARPAPPHKPRTSKKQPQPATAETRTRQRKRRPQTRGRPPSTEPRKTHQGAPKARHATGQSRRGSNRAPKASRRPGKQAEGKASARAQARPKQKAEGGRKGEGGRGGRREGRPSLHRDGTPQSYCLSLALRGAGYPWAEAPQHSGGGRCSPGKAGWPMFPHPE